MPNSFEIIDTIWRKEDAFDEVLNGNLFDAINGLQQVVSGNDPVWAKVVFEILFHYLTGFFFYHFCFSYGDTEAYKPERQRDLEHHIRKLLQTEGRDLISKICISSLHGKGWQTLYEIRPWRFPFTLNPLRLYRRFLGHLYRRFLRWLQKASGSARMGLEILGLFDHYTPEEFNELLLYVQHHARNKLPHEFNEWEILYTVRLMTRPQVLPLQEHDTLVDQILSIEFTREDIRMEILAELAKSSDKAVAALGTYEYLNPKHFATSAHINHLSMKMLFSYIKPRSSIYNVDDLLDKLGRLEKSSAEVLLQIDPSEEDAYSSAVLIATSVSALTIEARELLTSHLNSSNYHVRYLAACALLYTARITPVERTKVFNSILEIAIGPKYLEVSQDIYERRDPLQKRAVQFLLDLAENDPFLIKTFLKALRDTWKNEFANALGRFFSGCEIPDDAFGKVVDHLLDGNLSEVRVSAKQLCSELLEFLIGFPLDQIAANDFLPYALNDDGSPKVELVLQW